MRQEKHQRPVVRFIRTMQIGCVTLDQPDSVVGLPQFPADILELDIQYIDHIQTTFSAKMGLQARREFSVSARNLQGSLP